MNRGFVFFSRVFFAFTFATTILAISGCNREPFDYVKVQGKVSYEDGSLIPAQGLTVRFIPLTPPHDRAITPRPGNAKVDANTGMFDRVTSHTFGDGIVVGDHKVTIVGGGSLVPDEYTRAETTPLRANSKDSPFDFKIKKPSGDQ